MRCRGTAGAGGHSSSATWLSATRTCRSRERAPMRRAGRWSCWARVRASTCGWPARKRTSSGRSGVSSWRSTARSITSSPTKTPARRRLGAPPATTSGASAATTCSVDDAALAQQGQHCGGGGGGVLAGPDPQVGRFGRLVGVVDAGHARDLAGASAGVQALRVALLAELQRRVDEDLEEVDADLLVDGPRGVAVRRIRADQRDDGDGAGVGEVAGHVRGPPDVLGAVLLGEAEVAVDAVAQVVAVEPVRIDPGLQECGLAPVGHRRLP